jgi:hypothetical protein
MSDPKPLQIEVAPEAGAVSALWLRPPGARAVLTLAHGAGAGMQHAFMEAAAVSLAAQGIATLRYQFPYMEAGKRRIDSRPKLHTTVRAAAREALKLAGGLPVFVGGKSMGGRMTSQAAAETPLEGVDGIVFFGFPLHPAGKPGIERADHLSEVTAPMCFLQGTRDKLADLVLLGPVIAELGTRATLHVIEGADHGFSVLKRSGRTDEEVLAEICALAADFMVSA